jgi:two-component system, NtrC family, response regulator HydG
VSGQDEQLMSQNLSKSSTRSRGVTAAQLTVWINGEQADELTLDPSRVTTIGRHPICTVPLSDSLCSRHHSEIFLSGEGWVIRDLESRNGTFVNKERIAGDCPLLDRSVIHIGSTVLMFAFDKEETVRAIDTVVLMDTYREGLPVPFVDDAHIVSEASRSRFRPDLMSDVRQEDLIQGLRHLYRMALETASAANPAELAGIVLDGVLDATRADCGAVLIARNQRIGASTDASDLIRLAYRSRSGDVVQVVSQSLTRRAIAENRAVLAYDVLNTAGVARQAQLPESLAEMEARSVICAPVRRGDVTIGMLHVYSIDAARQLEDDDLHLTLAAADHLALALEGHTEKEELRQQLASEKSANQVLREQLAEDSLLVGQSESICQLREEAHRVAPTDVTVLIRGESGVGKELVARTIHQSSRRADRPFVCMNCAALTESLLESELFGHEKGSFTGATERKVGKFEQADDGTLFLDEVGEMSLAVQAKFLRVLEGHPFERVGGRDPVSVDVRVVAATNRDLEAAVKAGEFRQDLYFRLHVMQMMIDPLRDRPSDILVLANHFLDRLARKAGMPRKRLTTDAADKLSAYHWPGNVRELQNTIERALILCRDPQVTANDIRLSNLEATDEGLYYNRTPQGQFRELSLERLEFEHLMATLDYTQWNKSQAARILGIERSTLDRKLQRAGVQRPG